MDKKSILIFIDELYFYNPQNNSYVSKFPSGNFIKMFLKEVKVDGVFVFPVNDKLMLDNYSVKLECNKYQVETLPTWDSILSYYKFISIPKNYLYLKNKIRKLIKNSDVFWIRLPSPFGLWLGNEAEKNGKLVIYHVAGDIRYGYLSPKYKGPSKIAAWLFGKYLHIKTLKLGKNAVFLCTGSKLYDIFKKNGKEVVYFIDSLILSKYLSFPKEKLEDPIRFLYVGRILEEKGIFFLIEALDSIKERYNFVLSIVGHGKDEKKLLEVIKEKNYIKYYGFIKSGDELNRVYRENDILIMPSFSFYEGFPRVILEAWANGLYVISSKVGGIEGLGKDGDNILFFTPKDKIDLINKISDFLNNEELRFKLRSGILSVQKEITFEYMVYKLRKILEGKGYYVW